MSHSKSSSHMGSQWVILAAAAIVIVAAFAMWMKQRSGYKKLVDPMESTKLLENYST